MTSRRAVPLLNKLAVIALTAVLTSCSGDGDRENDVESPTVFDIDPPNLIDGMIEKAEWELVGKSADGEKFYLNRSSISEIGANRVAMTMTSYPIADEDGARSNVSLHEFDCIGKRWRTERMELFEDPLGREKPFMKFDKKIEWETIPSKTIAADVLKTVCSR